MNISPVTKAGGRQKSPELWKKLQEMHNWRLWQSCMVLPNWFQVCEPAIFSVFKQFSENEITYFERSFLNLLIVVVLDEMLIILDSKMYLISVSFYFVQGVKHHFHVYLNVLWHLSPSKTKGINLGRRYCFHLYIKDSGILLVAPLGVVLWTMDTIHLVCPMPFLRSWRFLIISMIILLVTSAFLFPSVYISVEVLRWIRHLSQKPQNLLEVNWEPLSVTILSTYDILSYEVMYFSVSDLNKCIFLHPFCEIISL